uniref:Copper transporter n=1 Tax=Meloidogyne hapla TaxID=6305 RepID=A0A1I8AZ30_MELHA
LILNLFWWNNVNNTNICKENKISKFPSNAIVPADYITEFNKLRQLCYGQPGFNSSDPNSVKNELISKIGQLRIYQPKSFFPMDPAVVVLWFFAFISILLGSLWSVLDLKNKLAVREEISTALGNLQSYQNASLTHENTGVSSSTIQIERKRSTQSSELANMNVYQHCISVFVALSVVVFVLMFAFFFRNYAVNAFNFFLISLGSVAIKSCIYAILQYLLNGFDYEMVFITTINFV